MRFFLAAVFCAGAIPAHAQLACGYLADLIAYGADELGQVMQVTMTDPNGSDVYILADPEGNWSLLLANGTQACVMAIGTDFVAATGL